MTAIELRQSFHNLTEQAEYLLREFLSQYGGECHFPKTDCPVIAGQFKFGDGSEDILLTHLLLQDGNLLYAGYPARSYSAAEQQIDYIEPAYYPDILDAIK
ncbi:MAG: hypothetical protein NC301_08005 [Bacteroides sp.]|nr:hypothetical protein [Bacteroides sp.]MCM1379440.1 hypothetical protein [Bacteroides sp.]MCM1445301.1 hypothetical protein [Prevotella sp.]